jgi:hypothetical protein
MKKFVKYIGRIVLKCSETYKKFGIYRILRYGSGSANLTRYPGTAPYECCCYAFLSLSLVTVSVVFLLTIINSHEKSISCFSLSRSFFQASVVPSNYYGRKDHHHFHFNYIDLHQQPRRVRPCSTKSQWRRTGGREAIGL